MWTRFCLLVLPLLLLTSIPAAAQTPTVTRIAGDLNNPRGVAILPDGGLLVVEAGLGTDVPGEAQGSGRISQFTDMNGDGDFDDPGERQVLLDRQASYNSLTTILSFHDEVYGLGDIELLDDGRIFYGKDDPYARPGHAGTEGFYGEVGIFELDPATGKSTLLVKRTATLNALVYNPDDERFYVVESGFNRLMAADHTGEPEVVAEFDRLAHGQQAVPAGIALDESTGDILVALLSGHWYEYYGTDLAFLPGDAKVAQFNPFTGTVSDAITGLTTAIDVAADEAGNVFVVELTTTWPSANMPSEFDLHDPGAPPDPGGYARFTGRVTLYPAAGGDPVVLADGLDTPTNITYADGSLYVSTGLGTPGRSVLTPGGDIVPIEGVIYRITGF